MKKLKANLVNLQGYSYLENVKSDRYRITFRLKVRSVLGKCPKCSCKTRVVYETKTRRIRHCYWDKRACILFIKQRRFKCRSCKSRFWESLPGISKYSRRTQRLKEQIARDALNGHDNKLVAKKYKVGQATVQRDINLHTKLENKKKSNCICPVLLGIDEHFFTKKKGYATTLCDLKRRKIFDVRLGRSELSLVDYFNRLKDKERCKVVCIDLSTNYRSMVKKHFPKAMIVADRFHVIRLLNQYFMELWKLLDPKGRKNRGLVSLYRRKPSNLKPEQARNLNKYLKSVSALKDAYDLRNEIHSFLSQKTLNARQFNKEIPKYFKFIQRLKTSGFKTLKPLAKTLESWQEEILRMLRFTRNNGITEGFHCKMERISRQAYGFRNFQNYRQRVLLKCS